MRPRTFIQLVIITYTVSMGCQQKPAKDEYRLIEHIEVAGQCHENHVAQSAEYKGSLVHWFNVTNGKHNVYGGVDSAEDLDKVSEETANPNKYHPPVIVTFDDITPEQVAQPEFSLSGTSCRPGGTLGCNEPQYETSCRLKVVRRLDHLPEDTDGKPKEGTKK